MEGRFEMIREKERVERLCERSYIGKKADQFGEFNKRTREL